MTAAGAITLIILALLDGSFAGFRASAGRTGLIRHRQSDYQAARRGAGLVCILLVPAAAEVCADVLARPGYLEQYTRAGMAMLEVYGPYALLVLIALLRPLIAILGGTLAVIAGKNPAVAAAVSLSVIAVLAVEPLAGRLWYARSHPRGNPRQARPAARQRAPADDMLTFQSNDVIGSIWAFVRVQHQQSGRSAIPRSACSRPWQMRRAVGRGGEVGDE